MTQKIQRLVWLCVALFLPMVGLAALPGDYKVIFPFKAPEARSLDRVTIHEVFAFDCPHCYDFHKNEYAALKKKFKNKIDFVLQPIGWRGHDPGRLYFIAQQNGKAEPVLMMIFDFIFEKGLGREMFTRDKLQFVARMNDLTEEFEAKMDAPEIVDMMNKSVQFANERKIDATPTLVIEKVLIADRKYSNLVTIINSLLKEPVP